MKDSKLKVLLYSDGSYQAFSAAVYTATLLKNTPDMELTILQVQETDEGSLGTEYSWVELRPKYKRYHWGCSSSGEYSWIDTWPSNPKEDWMKRVLETTDMKTRMQYQQILNKTNNIFKSKKQNVNHQVLCSNTSILESQDISDTVNAIIEFATTNSIELIIMGTRGLSTLNGLIFGSLSHNVLNKSPFPVLLIKKLPQDFIDTFLLES
jgi:nucleotide-binding universal stress UspA family protein